MVLSYSAMEMFLMSLLHKKKQNYEIFKYNYTETI